MVKTHVLANVANLALVNTQLAKVLPGFVTGQIAVSKAAVTVACTVICRENYWRLHSSSAFSSEAAVVCVVLFGSIFSSLL